MAVVVALLMLPESRRPLALPADWNVSTVLLYLPPGLVTPTAPSKALGPLPSLPPWPLAHALFHPPTLEHQFARVCLDDLMAESLASPVAICPFSPILPRRKLSSTASAA